MKTEVCITVDTEFSIAGTFTNPTRLAPLAEPNVWCESEGRSHGLGFLLETFAESDIAATFFVEALNGIYFGDGPMRDIAVAIRKAGHDVQLHLHPVWTYFRDPKWRERLASAPPNDSFAGRPQHDVEALIETGLATFARWGMGRPVALRTGGLRVDPTVYRAMHSHGLPLGSNVGLGIYRPQARQLHLYTGRHRVHGVVEVPVLTYRRLRIGSRSVDKSLTVTGTSWNEMRSVLWEAHRCGIGPVIILTHPHEFIKTTKTAAIANRVNQSRLRALCRFLASERDCFEVVTFAERARAWSEAPDTDNACIGVPFAYAIQGMVENKLNDWIGRY